MTFEEMQRKFIVPDQDQYSWFLIGTNNKMSKKEVVEKILTIEDVTHHFIHQDKYVFYVGVDLGKTIPEDMFNYIDPVDEPVSEE